LLPQAPRRGTKAHDPAWRNEIRMLRKLAL
jgi:hypothetical protein